MRSRLVPEICCIQTRTEAGLIGLHEARRMLTTGRSRPPRAHTPEMGTSLLSAVGFPPATGRGDGWETDNSSSCPERTGVARKATISENLRGRKGTHGLQHYPHPQRKGGRDGGWGHPFRAQESTLGLEIPHFVLLQGRHWGLVNPDVLEPSLTKHDWMEGGRQATRRDCQDGADGGRRVMAGAGSTHRPGEWLRSQGGPGAGSAGAPVCVIYPL